MHSEEYEEIQHLVIKAFEAQKQLIDERFEKFEQAYTIQEQQVAALVQAYAELATIVETLASMIMNRSEEEKKEFFESLALARKQMIDTIQHGIQIAEQNIDKFTAYAPDTDGESQSDKIINDS